jgi:hypothetical protein
MLGRFINIFALTLLLFVLVVHRQTKLTTKIKLLKQ